MEDSHGDYFSARSLPAPSSMPLAQAGNTTRSSLSSSSISHTSLRGRVSASLSLASGRTLRKATSKLLGRRDESAPAPPPPPEREWTLFSQRMQNEGQIPSSTSVTYVSGIAMARPSARRATSHNPTPGHSSISPRSNTGGRQRPVTLALPSPHSEVTSYLGTESQVQSPVEDQSMLEGPVLQPAALRSTPEIESAPVVRVGWKERVRSWTKLSVLQKNIVKCSIAYFLGSLFTFNPYLSEIVGRVSGGGPSASGHMVATVAVYFNPAKTAGGMLEADVYCLLGLLFASLVSILSMDSFWFFEVQPGYELLADFLVILWVGLAMSLVAWSKQWMAKPTFNPACSMVAIILFTVVVKEGGADTLLQVALLVCFGAIISNAVCLAIWPRSATTNLRTSMNGTVESFATLLRLMTQTFLLESEALKPSQEKIQKAAENHQSSFVKLKKDLSEAHSEALFGGPSKPAAGAGREDLGKAYEDAVGCLNRLGQHLNGLRSGTRLQFELAQAHIAGKIVLRRDVEEKRRARGMSVATTPEMGLEDDQALLQATADMFGELVNDLGSPLKALSTACENALHTLSSALSGDQQEFNAETFDRLVESIDHATRAFESTSNHAVVRIYRQGNLLAEASQGEHAGNGHGGDMGSSTSINFEPAERETLRQDQNESLFLIYFFIFTLQEFASELESLVDALGRVCALEHKKRTRGGVFKRLSTRIARLFRSGDEASNGAARRTRTNTGLKRPISSLFKRPRPTKKSSWFPKVKPHAPDTLQTPGREHLSFWGRVKQRIWAAGNRVREADVKYAVKAGMATALLAAPAWFERTRPVFMEYRGEWALISFFVVISPTIGATNSLSLHRVLGTIFGALTAAGIYALFPDNPYVLSIFGFFFSIPCFYYIVAFPQYATSGRFVLLTYNLTCLFSYNQRDADVYVVDVAIKRSVAVIVGVLWAFIVSRTWWPSEARRELGKLLGEFCLDIGWLYIRMVAHNSLSEDRHLTPVDDESNERTPLILLVDTEKAQKSIHEFMAMELHLQIQLIKLQGLLAQAQHEPRLKGPFPVKLYRGILTHLQTILDRLHSMRCVTTKDEWFTNVRRDYILPVNKERRTVIGNIILFLSIIASAFQLKTPLPPYLPPVEESRIALVDAIKGLDVMKTGEIRASKQLLFFAYAMTMKGVTQELEVLGRTLQETFGVIGQHQFDALFAPSRQVV